MEIIALNDENRLGTGTRVYLVLKRGRKWVRLLSLGCLRKITVAKQRAACAHPVEANPTKLVKLLDRLTHYYRYRLSANDLATIHQIQSSIRRKQPRLRVRAVGPLPRGVGPVHSLNNHKETVR